MPRRGENIYKRKDGRWEGRYKSTQENGKSKYVSIYGHTYSEIKEKMKKALINQRCYLPQKSTFEQAAKLWLEFIELKTKAATVTKYSYLLNKHILPELSDCELSGFTKSSLRNFLRSKQLKEKDNGGGKLSASYIKEMIIIINSVLQYAFDIGLLNSSPPKIRIPQSGKKVISVFTPSEQKIYETFLKESLSITNIGILIAFYSGMRLGELCALKWENVDMDEKIIHICSTVSRIKSVKTGKTQMIIDSPKTPSSLRDIPMNETLFSFFEQAKKLSGKKYVLSKTDNFTLPRTFEYNFKKSLKKANIKNYNFHSLRHTFATRCIESGIDAKSLSELLGHSNVSITLNTYVHSSIDLKRKQLDKISSL